MPKLPSGEFVFWSVVIALGVRAFVKHVAPKVPVAGEYITKLAA